MKKRGGAMKKIIEKMVLALLVSLIILSINMQVFANYNEWTAALGGFIIDSNGLVTKTLKGEEVNKNLAKFIKGKNEDDLKKAYDGGGDKNDKGGKITNTWVKDAMKKLEKEKDSTYKDAYTKLEEWDFIFDSYVQQRNQSNEIDSGINETKDYKNFTLRQMIDTYEKAGHSLEGIKNSKNGKEILKKWYDVVVEKNTQLDDSLKTVKVEYCPSSEKMTYEQSRQGLSQLLQEWKKKQDKKDKENEDNPIYQQPGQKNDGKNLSSEKSLEDMVNDADSFVNTGTAQYNQESMQNFSKTIYNIMFTIGIFAAVIVGGVIGIRLMISSASEKAEAKKLLVPYVVGCVVVFGGFGIWKLVVTILQGI